MCLSGARVIVLRTRHPPSAALFPYTTLFRSPPRGHRTHETPRSRCHVRAVPRLLRRGFERALESAGVVVRSEEHTSELQSLRHLVCRVLLEKKKKEIDRIFSENIAPANQA